MSQRSIFKHREERVLACDVFTNIFKSVSALKIHVCSYTWEKPFKSDVCNKTFMKPGNLNAHLHTHAGQQPFTCDIFKKTFHSVGLLQVASAHSYKAAAEYL